MKNGKEKNLYMKNYRLEKGQEFINKQNYNWRLKVKETKKLGCRKNIKCSKEIIGNVKYCLEHWFDRAYVSKPNRFSVTVSELLELWEKQKGKCAITGINLIPGSNVALDHKIPLKQNGTKTIENLRFIHYNINLIKYNLNDFEFKQLLNDLIPKLLNWSKEI